MSSDSSRQNDSAAAAGSPDPAGEPSHDVTSEEGLRTDAGNPNRDRSDLGDQPPAQVDEDAVREKLDDGTDEAV